MRSRAPSSRPESRFKRPADESALLGRGTTRPTVRRQLLPPGSTAILQHLAAFSAPGGQHLPDFLEEPGAGRRGRTLRAMFPVGSSRITPSVRRDAMGND